MKEVLGILGVALILIVGVFVFVIKITNTTFGEVEYEYKTSGVVVKLIVRGETSLSSRSESIVIETHDGYKQKIYSDMYLVGDTVDIFYRTGGGMGNTYVVKSHKGAKNE